MTRIGVGLSEQRGQEEAGRNIIEEALAFHQGFVADKSDDPKVILNAARAWSTVAHYRDQLGQHTAAVEAQKRAIDLFDVLLVRVPSPGIAYECGRRMRQLAHLLTRLGRTNDAVAAYEDAIAAFRSLCAQAPENLDYRVNLANSLLNLATAILTRMPNRAESLLTEALAIDEEVLAQSSQNK